MALVLAVALPAGTVPLVAVAPASAAPSGTAGLSGLSAFYRLIRPPAAGPPGEVIRSMPVPSPSGPVPPGSTVDRILYHSRSILGSDVVVSGVVVVPGGKPPAGGFPIISWAHGTTGLADRCAPSRSGAASLPPLAALDDGRAIVVATDYQGLGTTGLPPYLVGLSEAQNVLDAARAAEQVAGPAASNAVAVLGFSQGGQAALFAAQIAQDYAPDLFVTGVVAAAPVTSLDEFVPDRPSSRSDPAAVYAVMALDAWSRTYGNLDLSTVLTRQALASTRAVDGGCSSSLATEFDSVPSDRVFLPGWEHGAGLRDDAELNDPGRAPATVPVLVVEGSEDDLTPTATVTRFVGGQLCHRWHDTVTYLRVPGAGHGDVLAASGAAVTRWIDGRLTGAPVEDSCGAAG